jgi:vacuolar protein sorting-associated protein 41
MLQEAQQISQTPATGTESKPPTNPVKMALEAQIHFLNTLVAWGPTKVLKEYIKLLKSIRERRPDDASVESSLKTVEIFLQRRYLQTAAGYLNFPIHFPTATTDLETDSRASVPRFEANSDDSQDSLFNHSVLLKLLAPRAPLASIAGDLWNKNENQLDPSLVSADNRMCLDAIARLQMMDDRYDLAMRCFLAIGAFHSPQSLEELEAAAIEEVNNSSTAERKRKQAPMLIESSSYEFVLGLIEFHHLHQVLLNKEYLVNTDSKLFVPLFALLRLVGLDLMGDFLIDHCVSPEIVSPAEAKARSSGIADDDLDDNVRRETLPIDQVADQLEQSPALLHWYLHKVFTRKPEIYVKFPYTANPPKVVTGLHRRHFNLYVQFAGANRDTAKSLYGTEAYKVETVTTPLLSFLKVRIHCNQSGRRICCQLTFSCCVGGFAPWWNPARGCPTTTGSTSQPVR